MNKPTKTAPPPRQPINNPNPLACNSSCCLPIAGNKAHNAHPAALKATVRINCDNTVWECRANRTALTMPPHKRSGGSRDGGCGLGGCFRTATIIRIVLATAKAKFQAPPAHVNTRPAKAGPTARAAL